MNEELELVKLELLFFTATYSLKSDLKDCAKNFKNLRMMKTSSKQDWK